jgi:hypothetical protein
MGEEDQAIANHFFGATACSFGTGSASVNFVGATDIHLAGEQSSGVCYREIDFLGSFEPQYGPTKSLHLFNKEGSSFGLSDLPVCSSFAG